MKEPVKLTENTAAWIKCLSVVLSYSLYILMPAHAVFVELLGYAHLLSQISPSVCSRLSLTFSEMSRLLLRGEMISNFVLIFL